MKKGLELELSKGSKQIRVGRIQELKAYSVMRKYGFTDSITVTHAKDGCCANTPWVKPPIK